MRTVSDTTLFRKDVKRGKKRGVKINKLDEIIIALALDKSLPKNTRPHKLSGEYTGLWDVHIEPDWILIYEITETTLILRRTGTHSDLFK